MARSMRNCECFCGSGLKYKKCCQNKKDINLLQDHDISILGLQGILEGLQKPCYLCGAKQEYIIQIENVGIVNICETCKNDGNYIEKITDKLNNGL